MFGLFKKFDNYYLDVPYAEKDQAKALGASWDPKTSQWYAGSSKIKSKCQKWWPEQDRLVASPETKTFQNFRLNVQFEEKDAVKSLGARWNADGKFWYAPNENVKAKCEKWWPLEEAPTSQNAETAAPYKIRGPFEILESAASCYRCNKISKVAAIAVANISEDDDEWYDCAMILNHMDFIPTEFVSEFKKINKGFAFTFSKTIGKKVWMNHCDDCNAHFGDFFLIREPGGAFYPTSDYEAQDIKRHMVLGLNGEYSYSGQHITDYKDGYGMRMGSI